MLDDIIGMHDMGLIFQVTDAMGIDRESISVPLGKEDPGAVKRLPTGEVEIVVPKSLLLVDWLATLQLELEKLGFDVEDSQ